MPRSLHQSSESRTKQCPYCAEEIKAEAIKCKHCGSILDDANSTAAAPRAPASKEKESTVAHLSVTKPVEVLVKKVAKPQVDIQKVKKAGKSVGKMVIVGITSITGLFLLCGIGGALITWVDEHELKREREDDALKVPALSKKVDSLISRAMGAFESGDIDSARHLAQLADTVLIRAIPRNIDLGYRARRRITDFEMLMAEADSHTMVIGISDEDYSLLRNKKLDKFYLSRGMGSVWMRDSANSLDSAMNVALLDLMYKHRQYRITYRQKLQRERAQFEAKKVTVFLEDPASFANESGTKSYAYLGRIAGNNRVDAFISPCAGLEGRSRVILERIQVPQFDVPSIYEIWSVPFPHARYYRAYTESGENGRYCSGPVDPSQRPW